MAFGLGEFIKSHSMNADVLCRLHGLSESESDVPAKGSSPRPARCTSRRLRWLIEATDRQIDALVYELYGLTEERSRLWREGDEDKIGMAT